MKNKRSLVWLCLCLFVVTCSVRGQDGNEFAKYKERYDCQQAELLRRQYHEVKGWFDDAYQEYPTVPRGFLEAISYQYARFTPNIIMDTLEPDPSERPRVYSVMGLTLHGKGVFRENTRYIASLSPYSLDEILWQPGVAVKAYACAFAELQQHYGCFGDSVEQYKRILMDLCELPLMPEGEDAFAMNSFLYMFFWFLAQESHGEFGVPHRSIDFEALFGDEYVRLKSAKAEVPPAARLRGGNTTPDYQNAQFVPAASCNYTSGRGGTTISSVTIHYTQGTYAGSIAWFQNCSAKASAHYVIRSMDGQVTQMVKEADKAWHVGVANSYTIGIEHEAYGDIASYFTMNMYQSSANLVKDICSRRSNINPHRIFYRDTLDGGTVLNYGVHSLGGATACTQIRGHQHYPSQTHTDPGPYWNWNLYYKLVNDNSTVVVASAENGTFTDSGGAMGDYSDDERRLFRIHVPGVESIVLTFQNFELETDYDFMWIYDGGSEFSPLIGRWNTQSPGQVVAHGDQMLVEFRSDCATTASGWTASWQANMDSPDNPDDGGDGDDNNQGDDNGDDDDEINDWEVDEDEPVSDNSAPQTAINVDASQWITGDFTANFNDSDDSGLKWRFYQIMESDGTAWSARPEQGFLCDNFDNTLNSAIWLNNTHSPWIIQDGELRQNNASLSYVGIAAHHNSASHTAYLFDFYLKFNSGEKCSFYFNCNNAPSQTSLFSGYEVSFDRENHTVAVYRLILGAKRLLKINHQVYFQTGTSYLCRVIYDSSSGEIIVMRHGNRLIRAVDGTLATTSNAFVGFVTRNAAVCVDNLRVYGSRTTIVPITVGSDLIDNIQSQAMNGLSRTKLKSIVVDKAYKFSPLVEKALKVDYTAPPAVTDLNILTETETLPDGTQQVILSATWNPTIDPNSGVRGYYHHKTFSSLCNWSPAWTFNGLLTSCNQCYTFNIGQNLAFSVIAENNAGLKSKPVGKIASSIPSMMAKKADISKFLLSVSQDKSLHIHYQPHCEHAPSVECSGPFKYSVFDMFGRNLAQDYFRESASVNFSSFAAGLYLVRISRNNEVLTTEKVILSD